ncbi:MAG: polysaccharide pyruvyl transferase family protein [Candidatus Azotimanducaceae bacterium WSBS_2022_MAG_OTU7]
MAMAGELLERYRTQAKLVITSKLHCALPCIAMGIPVIFFADKRDERLHLVREFIPINPYIAIGSEHAGAKILPTPDKYRFKVFMRRLKSKAWHHLRYRRAWQKIDWDPAPVDVTDVKKTILANLKRMIEKTP